MGSIYGEYKTTLEHIKNEIVEKLLAYAGIRRSEIVRDNIIFYNNHKHTNEDIFENIVQIELAIKQKSK